MKTFLKPLTSAEEKLCLKRCRKGDPEAKRILIEHNLRLVAHVAKKYQNTGEDLEDLISIGTIGLIKAISTFDIDRSARLSTYAARCIDNELLMMLRSRKKCSREVSLYEPIGTDKEGNEISLLDKPTDRRHRKLFHTTGHSSSPFFYKEHSFSKRISGHLLPIRHL